MSNRSRSIPPLQTVLLDGQEGSWETLSDIIVHKLLPQVDAMGLSVFQPSSLPLPPDAQMVPFQDVWVRQNPYPERFPQLAYVVAGQGEMILGARWFVLPAGQGIIIPANIHHAPHAMRSGQIKVADWLRILVYPFGVIVHRCRLTPYAHEKSMRYFIPNANLSEIFTTWIWGLKKHPEKQLRHKSLLCAFLCLLSEAKPVPINPMDLIPENFENLPHVLQKAILALHSSFNRPFQLPLLAERCFISPYYLCRIFRQYLNMTPLEYLTKLRLTIAKQLLEGVGLSIGDVAVLVGYQDWRHFHRLFVRYFGVSPSSVRPKNSFLSHRVFKPPNWHDATKRE